MATVLQKQDLDQMAQAAARANARRNRLGRVTMIGWSIRIHRVDAGDADACEPVWADRVSLDVRYFAGEQAHNLSLAI